MWVDRDRLRSVLLKESADLSRDPFAAEVRVLDAAS